MKGSTTMLNKKEDRGSPWPVPSMRMKGSDLLPLTSRIICASFSSNLTRLINFSGNSRYLRIFSKAVWETLSKALLKSRPMMARGFCVLWAWSLMSCTDLVTSDALRPAM